jgi:hypothetical protein
MNWEGFGRKWPCPDYSKLLRILAFDGGTEETRGSVPAMIGAENLLNIHVLCYCCINMQSPIFVTLEVKLTLCLTNHHSMKMYGGVEV